MREITVDANLNQIAIVTEFINAGLHELGCPDRIRIQIDVAVDELFGNMIRYAYGSGSGPATVRMEVAENPLCVVLILEHMRQSIDGFVGNAPQFDDITMLCLSFNGPEKPVKECELPAVVDSIPKAIAFAERELQAMECPVKTQSLLSVAMEEILSNIVHYAYGMGIGSLTVRTEALADACGAMITFMDTGIAFNPLEAPEPDVSLSAEERKAGGLGIFLARKMVDEMTYERVDGRNILKIVKRF